MKDIKLHEEPGPESEPQPKLAGLNSQKCILATTGIGEEWERGIFEEIIQTIHNRVGEKQHQRCNVHNGV